MTEAKDNSSLPLLLSITGAILVVAVGGWLFLDQEPSAATPMQSRSIVEPATTVVTDDLIKAAEAPPEALEPGAGDAPELDVAATVREEASTDGGDAELRKARLAADADILVFPPAQSALHYYGRVLTTDPQNEVAIAELDAILTKVGQTVTQHLEAEQFDEAYAIATLVAKQRPEHSLVVETQQTLDDRTEELVAAAIQQAQDGNDAGTDELLATAEALPGRESDYFTAIRESIAEIRDVRLTAERDRTQRARMEANQARAAWVDSVRTAITQGNLIAPSGASARDLLAERNKWTAERAQLSGELLSALEETAQTYINSQQLDGVEALLTAALELGGKTDRLQELRDSLENALVEAKENRIAQMTELVQLKSAPVRYPRRAQRLNLTGWVDVLFTVTPSGETADIEVNRADPQAVFDDAAIAAVRAWKFQPVEYRGQLISQRAGTRIVFRLE